jgi:hypothetical protein
MAMQGMADAAEIQLNLAALKHERAAANAIGVGR